MSQHSFSRPVMYENSTQVIGMDLEPDALPILCCVLNTSLCLAWLLNSKKFVRQGTKTGKPFSDHTFAFEAGLIFTELIYKTASGFVRLYPGK